MNAPEHSEIPPSSSARRVQCPQSAVLEPLYPDEDTQDTRDGVAAHWAAAEMLQGRLIDVGQIAPNNVALTEEMCRGADLMYDTVVKALEPYGLQPHQCYIETRVHIPRVHPRQWGSPDCYIVIALPTGRYLALLWDYKFGHGYVPAFENMQLVEYLAGITEGLEERLVDVVATIVQPRCFHRDGPVRSWKTSLVHLRALINIASNAAHEALGGSPRAKVGPECRDCKARHACTLLQREGFAAMDEAERVTPHVLQPAEMGLEARMLKRAIARLTARYTGLQAQIEATARNGTPVPGWALQPGQAREVWTVPAENVVAMAQLLGVKKPVAKPLDVITPLQAREAGMPAEVVAAMAKRGAAGMTLVEDDGSLARKVFT